MKLKSFQVTDFRSIRDSGVIDINDVTCFVGKNESGKTALMQALYRLNPINEEDMEFNSTEDYPRVDVDDYEYDVENGNRKPARVIKAWFELESDDLKKLVEDYSEKLIGNNIIELSRGYDNTLYFSIDISEVNLTEHLIKKLLPEELADEAKQHKTVDDLAAYCADAIKDEDKTESITPLQAELNVIQNAGGANKFFYTLYIEPLVPKFLYFDEYYQMLGQENLNALKQRRDSNKLEDADRPLLGLLEHARINLDKAINATNTQDLKNKLEGAGNRLTKTLLKFWSQNKHLQIKFDVREAKSEDPNHMRNGINIWAEIYDSKHFATTPMGRRSRGFVWFFSFLAYFGQQKAKHETPLILLLDEPGLSLHAKAQSDLLNYIEAELKPDHQVLYTTHSPFLVDANHFERVRLVQDDSMEDDASEGSGTKVTCDVLAVNNDTLFPLQGALGYEIHQTLFIGPNTLVVEGPSDLIYLKVMSDVLARKGKTALSEKWTITPSGGAGKIPMFVSLIGSQRKMNIATLMDIDSKTDQIAQQLLKQKLLKKKNLITCSQYIDAESADLEDLFDRNFYVDLVNQEFNMDIDYNAVNPSIHRVLVALKPQFTNVQFNHYRPARLLSERLSDFEPKISNEAIGRFDKLFSDLNALLRK